MEYDVYLWKDKKGRWRCEVREGVGKVVSITSSVEVSPLPNIRPFIEEAMRIKERAKRDACSY